MKKLSKIQILSTSISSALGFFFLIIFIVMIQNPITSLYFPSSLLFLTFPISLFICSYLIYKSATYHSKDEHTKIHHHTGPVILSLVLVTLSLFFIFQGVLFGIEAGGMFFTLRFTTLLVIALTNLTAAANLAVSSRQSMKTAILLLKTVIVMSFFLLIHILATSTRDTVYTDIIVYSLLNLIPQAIIIYYAIGFEKQLSETR